MTNKDQLFLIDRFCDEFESNLQQGSAVNIERVLESAKLEAGDPKIADVLLPELIALQIVYSKDRDAEAENLKSKYPERSEEIDSAGQQCSLLGTVNNKSIHTEIDAANTSSAGAPSIKRLGDRFENLEHFASGGLGDVYLGYDNSVRRRVAVKLLKPGLVSNAEARRRFDDEVAITGMLEHPGIVPIYDSGMSNDGQPFYAMRLLEGQTLKVAIKDLHAGGQASDNDETFGDQQRQLLRRLAQVCDAIAFAHDQGVIHRDLKPENILLGRYGETIVIDWGLARRELESGSSSETSNVDHGTSSQNITNSENATKIGSVLGTPEYMSPEQASGDSSKIVKQSDVYSLGAILYCVLTGTSPHRQNGVATKQRIEAAKQAEFPTAKEFNAATPIALNAICERAMHVDPGSRYPSPAALAEDINNWLSDQPVSAKPDNALERFSRFLRKYRRWSAAGAATLVAITVGSLVVASVINSQRTELTSRKVEAVNTEIANMEYVNFMNFAFENLRSANETKSQDAKSLHLADFVNELNAGLEDTENQFSKVTRLRVIGNVVTALNALGENKKALEKTRELLDLTIEISGEDFSLRHAEAKGALVHSLVKNNKHEEALELADETLAAIRSTEFPPNESHRISVIEESVHTRQLTSLKALKRWSEAVSVREDFNPWLKELDIDDLPESLEKLNLINIYIDERSRAGNVANLLEWQQKLYDAQKEIGGEKDPKSLSALHRLAQAIGREQGEAAALPYREDLVELASEVLGADHGNTMTSKENLAFANYGLGKFEQAIELYSQLATSWAQKDSDVNVRRNKRMIAESQLYLGREQQALETLQEIVDQDLAAGHADGEAVNSRFDWLIALLENGQVDQAIAAMNEDIKSKSMWDDHAQNIGYFVVLQFAHVLNGDFDEALLERDRIPNELSQKYEIFQVQIAEALCGLERWNEAKPLLEKLIESPLPKSNSPSTSDSLKCHVTNAKGLLAGIISKSDPERAEKLYLEAISELEDVYRVKMQTTRIKRPLQKFMDRLASFYESAGNKQKAEIWRKKIAKQTDVAD